MSELAHKIKTFNDTPTNRQENYVRTFQVGYHQE